MASEPEEVLLSDEPDVAAPVPAAAPDGEEALRELPAVLAEMGVGVRVGTLVHRVLEATDFAAADLTAELAAHVAEAQARRRVEIGDPAHVVDGLAAAIETPLGPLVGDVRLRDIARADRLDELSFELPLVGGDDADRAARARRDRRRARASTCRRAIRWAATPRGSRTPACAPACAGS